MYRELPTDPKDLKHVSDCFDLQYLSGIKDAIHTLLIALGDGKGLKVGEIIGLLNDSEEDIDVFLNVLQIKMAPLNVIYDPFERLKKHKDSLKEKTKEKPPKLTS